MSSEQSGDLELQLERELDRARAADLVEGIEAAVGASGAEAACQRLRSSIQTD